MIWYTPTSSVAGRLRLHKGRDDDYEEYKSE